MACIRQCLVPHLCFRFVDCFNSYQLTTPPAPGSAYVLVQTALEEEFPPLALDFGGNYRSSAQRGSRPISRTNVVPVGELWSSLLSRRLLAAAEAPGFSFAGGLGFFPPRTDFSRTFVKIRNGS